MINLKNRLLSRITITELGCWEWQGANRQGYGCIKINGKIKTTHRLSHEIFIGPIPEGLYVCHRCDNPKCINPSHLFLGTHQENMIDCLKKGRMSIPQGKTYKKGDKPLNRKLTTEQVLKVKNDILILYPILSLKEIAERNNISYDTIRDMRRKNRNIYKQ